MCTQAARQIVAEDQCIRILKSSSKTDIYKPGTRAFSCLTEEDSDFFTEAGKRFSQAEVVAHRSRQARESWKEMLRACSAHASTRPNRYRRQRKARTWWRWRWW